MRRAGFEPRIPAFERAKTVHASDRAATMVGVTYHIKGKAVPVTGREGP
jgi:hypothetical protein